MKGKAALSRRGVEFITRDLFKEPLDPAEIRKLATLAGGVHALLSTRTTQLRELGLDRGGVSDDTLIAAMAREPRLIRRPLLRDGKRLVIGFDAKAYAEVGA